MKERRLFVLAAACLIMAGCSDSGSDGGTGLAECSSQGDCVAGMDCVAGLCKRLVAPGGSCASSDAYCADGSECTDGVCPGGGEKEACGEDNPCKDGKVCVDNSCVKAGEIGSKCSDSNGCTSGTCIDEVCTVTVSAGQTCGTGRVCDSGLDCQDKICLKGVEEGGDCRSSVTYCRDGSCSKGKCVKGGDVPDECEDTDGDGISNDYDSCDVDTDGDTTVDCEDLDSDGDTIPDSAEKLNDEKCGEPADSDGDGVPDFLDTDSDDNGISDTLECCGIYDESATCLATKGGDGLFESCIDTDGDTIPDSSADDNDGDGIPDADEITGLPHPNFSDKYGETGPRGADCNGDTVPDDPGSLEHPFDCDGDTVPDYLDTDSDNDTVEDVYEGDADSNKDGYLDRYSQDSDGDGLSDKDERGDGTEPRRAGNSSDFEFQVPDIDGDGLLDGREVLCERKTSCDDPEKATLCDGICLDARSDVRHCGSCSTVCAAAEICSESACVPSEVSCDEEETNKDVCWGQCVDFKTDTANCGECGHVCPNGQACTDGTCTVVCSDESLTACGSDGCFDLTGDAAHCGDCSIACAATEICSEGACAPSEVSCDEEETDKDVCWGRCVDFKTDSDNCGECGNSCGDDAKCENGVCADIPKPDPGVEYIDTKYVKDADGDGFEDAIEYVSAVALGADPKDFICDPTKGAKKTDTVTDAAFDFFFILPYQAENYEEDNLNFQPKVSKLDVIFNMDTTNSMGAEVDNLKAKINEPGTGIIDQIRQRVSDSAFGVSRFDDFPTRPTLNSKYDHLKGNGVEDGGYGRVDECPTGTETQSDPKKPFRCDVPFKLLGRPETDAQLVVNNVAGLTLHHGGDFPESGYEALWQLVMGDDKTKAQARWYKYGNYSVFNNGSVPYTTKTEDRWGGAQFRNSSLPVVIHITDTTSHDNVSNCGDPSKTCNKDEDCPNNYACDLTSKTCTGCKPYDPAYVEDTHYSEAVHKAYVAKGARVISVYDDRDFGIGNQLNQLVVTSSATQALVPACAFKKEDGSWKCGENRCCTITNANGVAPNDKQQCVLSYGIKDADSLSTTLVDGVDALVKYAVSDIAAVVRGNSIEGSDYDTSCFVKSVMALDDGYIAPPQEPEASCNPKASPAKFNDSDYNNGYTNFAIGTSKTDAEGNAVNGAHLNFKVTAWNDVCVKPTEDPQIFEAYIDLIDPVTGMKFDTQTVSIVVPGVAQTEVN